jgi:hypothetical protein
MRGVIFFVRYNLKVRAGFQGTREIQAVMSCRIQDVVVQLDMWLDDAIQI